MTKMTQNRHIGLPPTPGPQKSLTKLQADKCYNRATIFIYDAVLRP